MEVATGGPVWREGGGRGGGGRGEGGREGGREGRERREGGKSESIFFEVTFSLKFKVVKFRTHQ